MWQASYWSPEYWAASYWPKSGAAPVGGPAVGGRLHVPTLMRAIAAEEYSRSLLDERSMEAVRQAVMKRAAAGAWLRKIEADYHQKCLAWAAYSVLLTEV